jgi:L-iditol 2-dehydrogenase
MALHGLQNPFFLKSNEQQCREINQMEMKCVQICIVAAGYLQAYQEAVEKLKPRGCLVVFSGLPSGSDCLKINFNELHYMEQTIVGAYGCCYRHGVQALNLLSNRAVNIEDMISHRMPLYDLGTALELVEHRKGMKILLYP